VPDVANVEHEIDAALADLSHITTHDQHRSTARIEVARGTTMRCGATRNDSREFPGENAQQNKRRASSHHVGNVLADGSGRGLIGRNAHIACT
jgi:hypothetical protein